MPKGPWQNRSALIWDEISIVSLSLLRIKDMHLSQIKGKTNNDTVVLDSLASEIVMGDFYQFSLVTWRSLWIALVIVKKIYGKSI